MKDVIIYYGWLNSFNSAKNGWSNSNVAKDLSKYDVLVFGDGVQNPSHGDFANTQVIIPAIKTLSPTAKIYGYVTINQDYSVFTAKVDQWDNLQVDGIFLDEAGYDYGKNRADFNQRVDYVHGKVYSKLCIANAWNENNILGVTDDVNFPNTTYNPSLIASSLTSTDFMLLESFPINTVAYSDGYENASAWKIRGDKAISLYSEFGVASIASNVIANDSSNGENLCSFAYNLAESYGLKYFGTSDVNYGSSTAAVRYWSRPDKAYGALSASRINQVVAVSTTPVKISTFNVVGPNTNVTIDASTDRIITKVSGIYKVSFDAQVLVSTARDVQVVIRKNGNDMPELSTKTRVATTLSPIAFTNFVELDKGDYLEVYVDASGAANMTIWNIRFVLKK